MSTSSKFLTTPAFNNLRKAYASFRQEQKKTKFLLHVDLRQIPTPVPLAFLTSLPLLRPAALPSDCRECGICLMPMISKAESREGHGFDIAARLPCGHVLGYSCLKMWFSPSEGDNNNTCPYCRTELFEKFANENTIQGMEQRLCALQWMIMKAKRGPTPGEKGRLIWLRAEIVVYWLEAASLELGRSSLELLGTQAGSSQATYPGMVLGSAAHEWSTREYGVRQDMIRAIDTEIKIARSENALDAGLDDSVLERLSLTALRA